MLSELVVVRVLILERDCIRKDGCNPHNQLGLANPELNILWIHEQIEKEGNSLEDLMCNVIVNGSKALRENSFILKHTWEIRKRVDTNLFSKNQDIGNTFVKSSY